jgi:holo-[acyl-carrier protein] synthase
MHYVGVDIIEIARVEKAVKRWGETFIRRLYTESELRLCRKRPSSLATRFAGKEAVMKALGTGARGVSWREIEILSEPSGKPLVNLYGKAQERASYLGLERIAISLSDSKDYAVAFVVGETK